MKEIDTELKWCNACKTFKPKSDFHKSVSNNDGLSYTCRECFKKYNNTSGLEYRKLHRNEIKKKTHLWRKANPINKWAYSSIEHHKKSNYTCIIKKEELIELAKSTPNCPICNTELDYSYGNKGGHSHANSPTLDRKNNDDILTKENCWILCRTCNLHKQDKSMQEFVNYCTMVSKKFGDRNG